MVAIDSKIEDLKQRAVHRKTQRYPEAFLRDAVEAVCRLRDEGWTQKDVSALLEIPWVRSGVGLAGGIVLDTVPESASNGEINAINFVPVGLYVSSAGLAWMGIQRLRL